MCSQKSVGLRSDVRWASYLDVLILLLIGRVKELFTSAPNFHSAAVCRSLFARFLGRQSGAVLERSTCLFCKSQ